MHARPGLLLLPIFLGGCSGTQSALNPASDDAANYFMLSAIMFAAGAVIFVLVLMLASVAALRPGSLPAWLRGMPLIIGAGFVIPVVLLTVLLSYGLLLTRQGNAGDGTADLTVEVTGHQFWWRIRYLTSRGDIDFETANELRLPVDRNVRLNLKSADVIHSFWIPSLAGKIDMIPGRTTILKLSAEQEGRYRGQCAEFCGLQHANMAMYVIAISQSEFVRWQEQQRQPAPPPTTPESERGRALFLSNDCGSCHTLRGTAGTNAKAPDLTHIGSREVIGAGMLPRNTGSIAGWIAGNQHIKPGNLMPDHRTIAGADLRALAGYLDGLR